MSFEDQAFQQIADRAQCNKDVVVRVIIAMVEFKEKLFRDGGLSAVAEWEARNASAVQLLNAARAVTHDG